MLGYGDVRYAHFVRMGNKLFNRSMAVVGHVGMGMLGYQFHVSTPETLKRAPLGALCFRDDASI